MITLVAFIVLVVLLGIFIGFAIAIIYHLLKYGIHGDATRIMTAVFTIVSIVLIVLAIIGFLNVDWEAFYTRI